MAKYRSVSISVDVDIDEFSTSDLIDELEYRLRERDIDIKSINFQLLLTNARKVLKKAEIHIPANTHNGLTIETMEDNIKLEHIQKVWNQYTSAQFEQLLPDKI
jgi:hypothetical protein